MKEMELIYPGLKRGEMKIGTVTLDQLVPLRGVRIQSDSKMGFPRSIKLKRAAKVGQAAQKRGGFKIDENLSVDI